MSSSWSVRQAAFRQAGVPFYAIADLNLIQSQQQKNEKEEKKKKKTTTTMWKKGKKTVSSLSSSKQRSGGGKKNKKGRFNNVIEDDDDDEEGEEKKEEEDVNVGMDLSNLDQSMKNDRVDDKIMVKGEEDEDDDDDEIEDYEEEEDEDDSVSTSTSSSSSSSAAAAAATTNDLLSQQKMDKLQAPHVSVSSSSSSPLPPTLARLMARATDLGSVAGVIELSSSSSTTTTSSSPPSSETSPVLTLPGRQRLLLRLRRGDIERSSNYSSGDLWFVSTSPLFGYEALEGTTHLFPDYPALSNEGTKSSSGSSGGGGGGGGGKDYKREDFFKPSMPTRPFWFCARSLWHGPSANTNTLELVPVLGLSSLVSSSLSSSHSSSSSQLQSQNDWKSLCSTLGGWPQGVLTGPRSVRVCAIRGPNCSSEFAALDALSMAIAAPHSCPLLSSLINTSPSSAPRLFPPSAHSTSPLQLLNQHSQAAATTMTRSSSTSSLSHSSLATSKNLMVQLSRRRIDDMQARAIEDGRLNEDQAIALKSCAHWLHAIDDDDNSSSSSPPPILLVHGVFGSGKSHAMCIILKFLVDVFNESDGIIYGKDDDEGKEEGGGGEEGSDVDVSSGNLTSLSRGLTSTTEKQSQRCFPPRIRKAAAAAATSSASTFHRILVASATNVAVDRILCGLRQSNMGDFARVGAARKVDKTLIEHLLPRSLEKEAIGYTESDLRKLLQEHQSTNGGGGGGGEINDDNDVEAILSRSISRITKESKSSSSSLLLKRRRGGGGGGLKGSEVDGTSALPPHIQRLLNARIFGVTCAATNFPVLATLRFPIVFLDESSQMLESTSFLPSALFGAVRILAVGDPKQLPPIMPRLPIAITPSDRGGGGDVRGNRSSTSTSSAGTITAHTHCDTMFERLSASGVPTLLLRTQYRCNPLLSGLASRLFYEGRLLDGVTRSTTGPLLRLIPPLCVIDYSGWRGPGSGQSLDSQGRSLTGPCSPILGTPVVFDSNSMGERGEGGGGQSLFNDFEADIVTRCICELLDRNIKPSDIGIICLYLAQVKRVREKLLGLSKQAKKEMSEFGQDLGGDGSGENSAYDKVVRLSFADKVNVNTVDAFQGAERKVILVATSRTRPSSSSSSLSSSSTTTTSSSSDHISNPRRLCVLLTRARNHLIVITHAASLYSVGPDSSWGIILRTASSVKGSIRSSSMQRLLEGAQ